MPTWMDRQGSLLIVDDDESIRKGLSRILGQTGYTVLQAGHAAEALRHAATVSLDLVIIDLDLPDKNGMELIADLQERAIDATLVVLTGHGSIESAVQATRKGVYDYLVKPVDRARLVSVVAKGVERSLLRREVRTLRDEAMRNGQFQELVGKSPAMRQVYRLIEQFALADAPVLITGESGTGKEIVARALHRASPRAAERLVAVNCAAIPENLLESEMFGHERGAFTGATTARSGCFELAHRGTLFLDEIGEMPQGLQSKLLRVLEDGRIRRVGGTTEHVVDARIVAATNAPIESLVREKSFREDLFYRLNVLTIHLPPLRERREDIPVLVEHFLGRLLQREKKPVSGVAAETMRLLQAYSWPGNGRELRNAVERGMILCQQGEIQPEHLPQSVRGGPERLEPPEASGGRIHLPVGTSIATAEQLLITETLVSCAGNKTRAAAILGISVKTLYFKLRRYEKSSAPRGPS